MNSTVPLYSVLIVALLIGAAIIIILASRKLAATARRAVQSSDSLTAAAVSLRDAVAAGTEALGKLQQTFAPASDELRANMMALPKVLESLSKIGSAQLSIMEVQRGEQAARIANPFGESNGAIPHRDVTGANQEYEVQQRMRAEGISREQALLMMNPANDTSPWDTSPWDTNDLFAGWK
jgi:hypothetical protein